MSEECGRMQCTERDDYVHIVLDYVHIVLDVDWCGMGY